ncbi:M17 family metallopeptidase [Candidatus Mycoplasma pogonae]
MFKISKDRTDNFLLKAVFKGDSAPASVLEKKFHFTENADKKEAYLFLGEKDKFDKTAAREVAEILSKAARGYDVDLVTFVTDKVPAEYLVKVLQERYMYNNAELFSAKTSPKPEIHDLVVFKSNESLPCFKMLKERTSVLLDAVNFARNLQKTPPNICNSEWLADRYVEELKKYPELKVTVLDKAQIEAEKMGLFLSVNRGSMYQPRLVVVEYNGNPESKEKTVIVGKGITFDSGGYNLKTGGHMLNMKYDMSGSAIAAATLKAVAQLKPKANFAAVLPLTDNRVNGDASLPDTVWVSKSGKSVEINNTDAEGRLILADGMTYALENLKATRVVTVATLTGAILVALGETFTGAWATDDQDWKLLLEAAESEDELVWRMPLHEDFAQNIRKSEIADLKNTDLSGKGGSNSAAMFLKEFAKDAKFVHLDVAGTADAAQKPTGVLVKTLAKLASLV